MKKIRICSSHKKKYHFKEYFLRTTVIISLIMGLTNTSYSQEKLINLNLKNVSLKEFFNEVQKQSEFRFTYNDHQVKVVGPITIQARGEKIVEILDRILSTTPYYYTLMGNQIIIINRNSIRSASGEGEVLNLNIKVTDIKTGEELIGVACMLREYAIYGVTNTSGVASLKKVPVGEAEIELQLLGYETFKHKIRIYTTDTLRLKMEQTSLEINEVSVVAEKSRVGQATSSKISRQAIDHLQATSLKDLMQLLPGGLLQGDKTMTGIEQIQLRTLTTQDDNNAFGVAILVDGIPISNNNNLNDKTQYSRPLGGIDLRQIETDNIESVEIIRGVPSAEYGDLTAGAVIVKTQTGEAPYRARAKITPSLTQASLSKGWKIGTEIGTINASFDYLNSAGDSRRKQTSFDRINGSFTYSNKIDIWSGQTKFSFSNLIDKNDPDRDEIEGGIYTQNKDNSLSFSHSGTFAFNTFASRKMDYSISYSTSKSEYYTETTVSTNSGRQPLYSAKENGIYEAIIVPASYKTAGGTKSNPHNLHASLKNEFFLRIGNLNQRFNMGVEYSYENNKGIGKYNVNDSLPLSRSLRDRSFKEIPALNQLSAYFEDNFTWSFQDIVLRLQAGVRYTNLQPGKKESVSSFSPRINLGISPTEWLDIKAAYGRTSKTPGMIHLYPEPTYLDEIVVNYGTGNVDEQYMMYHTYVRNYNYSNLKNSTTNKYEVGFDIKLKNKRTLSVTAYHEKNNRGFSSEFGYETYSFNRYDISKDSIKLDSYGKPIIDLSNPTSIDTLLTTSGKIGNTSGSLNYGVEIDFDFGKINAINTSFGLSGAYMRTERYDVKLDGSAPKDHTGSSIWSQVRFIYQSNNKKEIEQRISTMARAICHIPVIKMVASANFQVIWYKSSKNITYEGLPIGYIDNQLNYHPITEDMLNDPDYKIEKYEIIDGEKKYKYQYSLSKQEIEYKSNKESISPPIWLLTLRLTKDISDFMGFSFYVNNLPYYEPWQHNNLSKSKTERNSGTFAFGLELNVKF